MKTSIKLFLISFLLTISLTGKSQTGSSIEITDPLKYNDYIVEQQNNIGAELLVMIKMFESLPTEKQVMIDELNKVILTTQVAIANTKNLKPIANEFGLAASAIDLFKFYKKIMEVSYLEIVNIVYSESPDAERMDAIIKEISAEEAGYDNAFQQSQGKFASFHNFTLMKNELQDEISK